MMVDRRVDSTAQRLWRTYVPDAIRGRVNAVRAARRNSSWRKPRDFGDLRRTTPFSTWSASRGGSIARIYIAEFLEQHAGDIRGRALEIAGDEYIQKYGTGVTRVDILDVREARGRGSVRRRERRGRVVRERAGCRSISLRSGRQRRFA